MTWWQCHADEHAFCRQPWCSCSFIYLFKSDDRQVTPRWPVWIGVPQGFQPITTWSTESEATFLVCVSFRTSYSRYFWLPCLVSHLRRLLTRPLSSFWKKYVPLRACRWVAAQKVVALSTLKMQRTLTLHFSNYTFWNFVMHVQHFDLGVSWNSSRTPKMEMT